MENHCLGTLFDDVSVVSAVKTEKLWQDAAMLEKWPVVAGILFVTTMEEKT